ncbi:MAG: hypothetical protein V4773_06465 [Verrucomicrobiota bacterium]
MPARVQKRSTSSSIRVAKRAAAPRQPKAPKAKARGRGPAKAAFIPVMKALSVETVPAGDWRLEIKLDGYRALAVVNEGKVELWSRNRKPLGEDYPEVVAALEKLACTNAVLDGEIVALDEEGRSRFQMLQGRGATGDRPPIVYYVFDLLHRDGISLLDEPLEQRQAALAVLIGKKQGKHATLRLSPVFDVPPGDLLKAVQQQGLEGIIAKKKGSLYEVDRRSGAWLKCKIHGEQEMVVTTVSGMIELPPDVERIIYADVCGFPVETMARSFSYIGRPGGNGVQPNLLTNWGVNFGFGWYGAAQLQDKGLSQSGNRLYYYNGTPTTYGQTASVDSGYKATCETTLTLVVKRRWIAHRQDNELMLVQNANALKFTVESELARLGKDLASAQALTSAAAVELDRALADYNGAATMVPKIKSPGQRSGGRMGLLRGY